MLRKVIFACLILNLVYAKNINTCYHEVLKCNDCKGIDTWLCLDKNSYELAQKHLGLYNTFKSGKIKYLKKYTLDIDGKIYKKYRKFLKIGNEKLFKLQRFKSRNAVLLFDKREFLKGRSNGQKTLKFKALINKANSSRRVTYLFYCKNKQYEQSRLADYDSTYTLGNYVKAHKNTNGRFLIKKNILLYKIYKRYCK